jgi:hypothetical protein
LRRLFRQYRPKAHKAVGAAESQRTHTKCCTFLTFAACLIPKDKRSIRLVSLHSLQPGLLMLAVWRSRADFSIRPGARLLS